ncbi:MAG: DUF4912 domain-containing protein [Planctomycetaceae bacterium]|nr:DUF4912 domain-containing protein [Planctomycetaceae bacterium]
MITIADLRSQTVKDLSSLARKMGLTGVRSMKKDELVRALVKASKAKAAGATRPARGESKSASKRKSRGASEGAAVSSRATARKVKAAEKARPAAAPRATDARVVRKIQKINETREQRKDLSHATTLSAHIVGKSKKGKRSTSAPVPGRDRVVLLVRDPYWLQACWDVTRQSVVRARAALAEHWHTCQPILRLMQVDAGATTATAESMVRDIPVHGGVKNWYIDIKDSPNSYRVDLGYLAENGRFYALARSNVVTTPRPGSSDAIDENWTDIAENYEKIYALSGGYEETSAGGDLQELFEERLRRPMGTPLVAGGGGEQLLRRDKDFDFTVDAEMIIYGKTKVGSHVTLAGEPVKLRSDGTFTVRMSMPDRRQLLPVVANSRDGAEQRTIVLAVERNTKVMEPMIRESHT